MKQSVAVFGLFCSLVLAPCAHAQFEEVVLAKVIASQTLSGRVRSRYDDDGLAGVRVELCDAKWANPFASTLTGPAGDFHFDAMPKGIYHLRLSLPGMNPLLVTVRIKSRAPKALSLRMWVAT
jgi:hypothetical protein